MFYCPSGRSSAHQFRKMLTQSGAILHCEYLLIVRLIDPKKEQGHQIHYGLDLKQLFAAEAIVTCEALNSLLGPAGRFPSLPASQRWSMNILRSPGGPAGEQFDDGDEALSVGRNNLLRRAMWWTPVFTRSHCFRSVHSSGLSRLHR